MTKEKDKKTERINERKHGEKRVSAKQHNYSLRRRPAFDPSYVLFRRVLHLCP